MKLEAKQRLTASSLVDSLSRVFKVKESFEDDGNLNVLFNTKSHVHGEDTLSPKDLKYLASLEVELAFNSHTNQFIAIGATQ